MIKINLLDSVTERQVGTVVAVERKVGSPMSRLLLMSISVALLMLAGIGWDMLSTRMSKTQAEKELVVQQEKQKELEAVLKEQKELEAKIQNIDTRIDAIKKLRSTQAGPSAVLDAMVERISMTPELYLESIEQSGEKMIIKGSSRDQSVITQFGRSLEFSGGLFSNMYIETKREEIQNQRVSANPDAVKLEVVKFTIQCDYTPEKSGANKDATTAENTPPNAAPPPAGAVAPPQIAKN